ncbi:unnamed protein product, partial [Discosporangium mesarthrocarpum]
GEGRGAFCTPFPTAGESWVPFSPAGAEGRSREGAETAGVGCSGEGGGVESREQSQEIGSESVHSNVAGVRPGSSYEGGGSPVPASSHSIPPVVPVAPPDMG